MLSQYGPDLLVTCENAATMAKELVQGWLEEFMFAGDKEASKKALSVADWLSDHNNFKSHARNIPRRALEDHGLKIRYLEDDPELHDLYLSVAHAAIHTFSGTSAVKIIENQHGKAYHDLHELRDAFASLPLRGTSRASPCLTGIVKCMFIQVASGGSAYLRP